jgi:3,2-trans-enoyl-CoA isomerase
MKMIRAEKRDQVVVLKLDRGVTNPINLKLLQEMAKILRMMRYDTDSRAVVLTSSNEKFFSIGFDIPELIELGRNGFLKFYRAYNRICMDLYAFPKPIVAAITGHAIAGGCILALCCDYRFIAQGRKLMGLNEVKLGVPVPYPGDCMLRELVGARAARDMLDSGEFYEPEQLLAMGVVDGVAPLEDVLPAAIERAATLGACPHQAYALIKRNRGAPVEAQVNKRLEERQRAFVDLWFSDEARERLKEAVKKF